MTDNVSAVFGPAGALAERFEGYTPRPGQLALAELIERALASEEHALGEGPCGTGKGLAYGVPLAQHCLRTGATAVVATANIALQEQLFHKDFPQIADVVGGGLRVEQLKGRRNYACLLRCEEVLGGALLSEWEDEAPVLRAWLEMSATGDLSEAPLAVPSELGQRITVGPEDCSGEECPFFEACFAERAKARAAEAHIVVTNMALLCAHLAVREQAGLDCVLPPFDVVVIDEAHEAADIARSFFGFSLSLTAVERVAKVTAQLASPAVANRIRQEAPRFFQKLKAYFESPAYRVRIRQPGVADASRLLLALAEAEDGLSKASQDDTLVREMQRRAARGARTCGSLAERIHAVTTLEDDNQVIWLAPDRDGVKVESRLVDVSEVLASALFAPADSVILVSATMTTGGTFGFLRSELGVPAEARELCVESPFDFAEQALLVVPEGMPEPNDPAYAERSAQALREVIARCEGRTLGLFTSYRSLEAATEAVAGCGFPILRQGELPRSELVARFREVPESVLLGVDSFWTGVDVPGESLTAVVIDRLPFPHPEDPLMDALAARDRQAFGKHMLPRAIMKFRQGVGRLIRRSSDVGVVVVLDPRIATKAYGRHFLRSLPRMPSSRRLDAISRFLTEVCHAAAS